MFLLSNSFKTKYKKTYKSKKTKENTLKEQNWNHNFTVYKSLDNNLSTFNESCKDNEMS